MIKAINIGFSYGKNIILKDVSFAADDGDFICILGANGAGKSTLLKILSGSLKPDSGIVEIGSSNISKIGARALAKMRAVLEQESSFDFDYTVLDVVLLGRYAYNIFPQNSRADITVARECLERAGLKGFEERIYTRLSGGEKQRVQLARALCQIGENPRGKVLMLDEPSASLDPSHAHAAMRAASLTARGGGSVVAVLHDPNLAGAYASKILLLGDGKIAAFGTPEETLTERLLAQTYGAECETSRGKDGSRIVYFPATNFPTKK